jgi:hypothetical protein
MWSVIPYACPGTDRNVELVETLLDAEAGHPHAFPSAIVLPPGSHEDRVRRIAAWPADAKWKDVVLAAYRRFSDRYDTIKVSHE